MENAAKALLIAGGTLIGILLLTFFAYIYNQMSADTKEVYSMLKRPEISSFNQQFLNYEGREDLNIQDVVTIVNLARDNNESKKRPTTIEVLVDGSNWVANSSLDLDEQIKNNIGKKYKCNNVNVNPDSLLVNRVTISAMP